MGLIQNLILNSVLMVLFGFVSVNVSIYDYVFASLFLNMFQDFDS